MVGLREYYAILSGEYENLALEELRAILDVESRSYEVTGVLEGIALFKADIDDPSVIVSRAGFVREIGEVLTIASDVLELSRDIAYQLEGKSVRVEATRYKGYGSHGEQDIVRMLLDRGVKCSLRGEVTLRIFSTEGVIIAGLKIDSRRPGVFTERMPRRRPSFKPGTLKPQISRLFVNLSRLRRGGVFLDPFCGIGGFAIEACLMGASRVICGDIDLEAVKGAYANLHYYSCVQALPIRANAVKLPLADGTIDAIATDPPYGRSTSTKGLSYEDLVLEFLEEARRVSRSGGYIVYAGPQEREPWRLAVEVGLDVTSRYHMFVHGSLVREIVVARV